MDPYAACNHWRRCEQIYFAECVHCGSSSKRRANWKSLLAPGYHDVGCNAETCKGPVCTVECRAVCEFCFLKLYDQIAPPVELEFSTQVTAMKKLSSNRNAKNAYNKNI